jgi:hypothetical protein
LATAGDEKVLLEWDVPVGDGGSAIVGYTVQKDCDGSGWVEVTTVDAATLLHTVGGLENGVPCEFRVFANNDLVGDKPSLAAGATPDTVPDPPVIRSVSPSASGQLTVEWDRAVTNGSPIISYTVRVEGTGGPYVQVVASGASVDVFQAVFPDLANGSTYRVTVKAENDAGFGVESSADATPDTVPYPPVIRSVSPSASGQLTVEWDRAVTDGSPIKGYTVTATPGDKECLGSPVEADDGSWSCIVDGLAGGTGYAFTVVAENDAGDSDPSLSMEAYTVPDPPVIGSASPSASGQVTVSWTAPAANGSLSILSYTVTAAPGDKECLEPPVEADDGSWSCIVGGLDGGTPYTFTVVAANAAGASDSSASVEATPYTAPDPPLIGSASATASGQVTVSWTAQAANGSTILSYTVTTDPGDKECLEPPVEADDGSWSCIVGGLAGGTEYAFTVVAANTAGASDPSASLSVEAYTAPGASPSVQASPHDSGAVVSWAEPDINGSEITRYTVTAAPGGETCTTTSPSPSRSCTVGDLANGTVYAFTVVATNDAGDGPGATSDAATVTPRTSPGAPTDVTGVGGNTLVTVSWEAPSKNGGNVVTGYTVTAAPGGETCTTTGTPPPTSCTVEDLDNGTPYTFTVVAANEAGGGDSSVTVEATPYTLPDPPLIGSASASASGQVTVSWTAQAANG